MKKNKISNQETLNVATVNSNNVPDDIWNNIKEKIGVFNENDVDFIIWTEEIDVLKDNEKEFIEKIMDEHQGRIIDIISFR